MSIDTSAGSEPLEGADVRPVVSQLVADPAPLGLAAFAMTTFALSIANTNVWGAGAFAALGLALVYGGLAQLLAGMWEFVRKNTFGALAFTSYGAFWISYYVLVKFVVPGVPIRSIPVMLGVFPLGWTIFTAYMTSRPSGSPARSPWCSSSSRSPSSFSPSPTSIPPTPA